MVYTANYNKTAKVTVFDSLASLTNTFLHQLSLDVLKAAGNGDDYYIAMSGGSTPIEIFKRTPQGWGSSFLLRRMKFFWGDERCVPPDSDESNYGNADREWFRRINVPEQNINRIRGENKVPAEVKRYSELLKGIPKKNDLPCFDLVILGIGEDGHTASIFPKYMDLMTARKTVASTKHPVSGQNRITVTGPVINNARNVLFLATGKQKKPVLEEIFSDSEKARTYPAYHIRPEGTLNWFIDGDAFPSKKINKT
jgi:6-phosphogluconolactonase